MNHGRRRSQRRRYGCQVLHVTSEHIVGVPQSNGNEMGVNDIVGTSCCQQTADETAIIEWDDFGRLEKRCQSGLAPPVPPHLRHDGLGRPKDRGSPFGGCEEGSRISFRTIYGDQEACVENHSP